MCVLHLTGWVAGRDATLQLKLLRRRKEKCIWASLQGSYVASSPVFENFRHSLAPQQKVSKSF